MASDITKMDLYALLDAPETSTAPEIIRAFRKKALACHPDKFPNDDEKKELFLLIKRASEILADDEARKSYDACRQQKKRQQERLNQMDDKRKKMKETLERNEQRASQTATTPATPNNRVSEEKLRAEVERLRREGNRLVIEELEKLDELLQHDKQNTSAKSTHVLVKFLSKTTPYTESELRAIFGKYGPISAIAIPTNKRAMIEFQADQISKYAENEKGFIDRPFASVKIQGDASSAVDSPSSVAMVSNKRPRDTIDLTQPDFEDYEAMIFKKMSEHAAKS